MHGYMNALWFSNFGLIDFWHKNSKDPDAFHVASQFLLVDSRTLGTVQCGWNSEVAVLQKVPSKWPRLNCDSASNTKAGYLISGSVSSV